jgi:effector-binding domain-containing protein
MFKIGDFSKLSRVSVKALRYYDEIGLLQPMHIDPLSGYRYYALSQLKRLNRILVLKDLGFSLEQIAQLLVEDVPTSQMRGMLRLKQAELQRQLAEDQARLTRIEARLRLIEGEDYMPSHEVVLKRVPSQTVASVRDTIPTYSDLKTILTRLFAGLGQRGLRPTGPVLAVYYDPEYREHDVDVEAAVPVIAASPGEGAVTVRELPGAETMACVLHEGSYDSISQAYTALMTWIEANAYRTTGPNREIYLRGPESGGDPATYVTEVQFPVEKA